MNNFVINNINQASCVQFDCLFAEVCLQELEDCDQTPTDSLLVECDQKWNCNLCDTDEEYFIPYKRGEKIQIQTIFTDLYSDDRTNPDTTDWLTVELYNQNGFLTSDKSLFLSRWLFGWNGSNNYQIFEIDTSLFASKCFSLKFITEDGVELCSQDFNEIDQYCSPETILIRGMHEDFDCNGFYYGKPISSTGSGDAFQYDNTMRMWAGMYARPATLEKTVFASKQISAQVDEVWSLVLNQPIPPYIDRLLVKTYLQAPITRVTDDASKTRNLQITSHSARDKIDYSNMMLYSADLFIRCNENVKRC
jgi:hypothetical protein